VALSLRRYKAARVGTHPTDGKQIYLAACGSVNNTTNRLVGFRYRTHPTDGKQIYTPATCSTPSVREWALLQPQVSNQSTTLPLYITTCCGGCSGTYRITATDSCTGKTLPGATVTATMAGQDPVVGTTDNAGKLDLVVPAQGNWSLQTSKAEYQSNTVIRFVTCGAIVIYNVSVLPRAKVNVLVKNAGTGAAEPNVRILMNAVPANPPTCDLPRSDITLVFSYTSTSGATSTKTLTLAYSQANDVVPPVWSVVIAIPDYKQDPTADPCKAIGSATASHRLSLSAKTGFQHTWNCTNTFQGRTITYPWSQAQATKCSPLDLTFNLGQYSDISAKLTSPVTIKDYQTDVNGKSTVLEEVGTPLILTLTKGLASYTKNYTASFCMTTQDLNLYYCEGNIDLTVVDHDSQAPVDGCTITGINYFDFIPYRDQCVGNYAAFSYDPALVVALGGGRYRYHIATIAPTDGFPQSYGYTVNNPNYWQGCGCTIGGFNCADIQVTQEIFSKSKYLFNSCCQASPCGWQNQWDSVQAKASGNILPRTLYVTLDGPGETLGGYAGQSIRVNWDPTSTLGDSSPRGLIAWTSDCLTGNCGKWVCALTGTGETVSEIPCTAMKVRIMQYYGVSGSLSNCSTWLEVDHYSDAGCTVREPVGRCPTNTFLTTPPLLPMYKDANGVLQRYPLDLYGRIDGITLSHPIGTFLCSPVNRENLLLWTSPRDPNTTIRGTVTE
jgi:hypothetical protein